MTITNESGFGLQGALDGQNKRFRTSQAMRSDLPVEVYCNGYRLVAGLEDGYRVVDDRTIEMKMAPVDLDTIAVKFSVDVLPVGLPNGTPQIMPPVVLGAMTLTAQVAPTGDTGTVVTVYPR